jgi:hypothetical protein
MAQTIQKSNMVMDNMTVCPPNGNVGLERTRFFQRQLITPDDLNQNQTYFREKMRRHNRMLHGWGVVCGVRVRQGTGDCEIVVEPGYILGPYGDEIIIDQEVTVDLCREGLDGNAVSPCANDLDPWCNDIRVNRQPGQPLYVAVRYAECQSRPVRVHTNGCGCNEGECEYSRIRDSYAVKVLTSLPESYSEARRPPRASVVGRCTEEQMKTGIPCFDCPTEPWVILADVVLDNKGTIAKIDCFSHRRYILSFAEYYFQCLPEKKAEEDKVVIVREIDPDGNEIPRSNIVVAIRAAEDRILHMPVNFAVEEGETARKFLNREGERVYEFPETGRTFTLKDVFEQAEIKPETTFANERDLLKQLGAAVLQF